MITLSLTQTWIIICSITIQSCVATEASSPHHSGSPHHGTTDSPRKKSQNTAVPIGVQMPEEVLSTSEVSCISADTNIFEIMNKAKQLCEGNDMVCTFYFYTNHKYYNIGTLNINKQLFDNLLMKYDNWLLTAEKISEKDGGPHYHDTHEKNKRFHDTDPIKVKEKHHKDHVDESDLKDHIHDENHCKTNQDEVYSHDNDIGNSIHNPNTQHKIHPHGIHKNNEDIHKLTNNENNNIKNGSFMKLNPKYDDKQRQFEVFIPKDKHKGNSRTIHVDIDGHNNNGSFYEDNVEIGPENSNPDVVYLNKLAPTHYHPITNYPHDIQKHHSNDDLKSSTKIEIPNFFPEKAPENILNPSMFNSNENIFNLNAFQKVMPDDNTGKLKSIVNVRKYHVKPNQSVNQAQYYAECVINNNNESKNLTPELNSQKNNEKPSVIYEEEISPDNAANNDSKNTYDANKNNTKDEEIDNDDSDINLLEHSSTYNNHDFDDSRHLSVHANDVITPVTVHLNEPVIQVIKHSRKTGLKSDPYIFELPTVTPNPHVKMSDYIGSHPDSVSLENRPLPAVKQDLGQNLDRDQDLSLNSTVHVTPINNDSLLDDNFDTNSQPSTILDVPKESTENHLINSESGFETMYPNRDLNGQPIFTTSIDLLNKDSEMLTVKSVDRSSDLFLNELSGTEDISSLSQPYLPLTVSSSIQDISKLCENTLSISPEETSEFNRLTDEEYSTALEDSISEINSDNIMPKTDQFSKSSSYTPLLTEVNPYPNQNIPQLLTSKLLDPEIVNTSPYESEVSPIYNDSEFTTPLYDDRNSYPYTKSPQFVEEIEPIVFQPTSELSSNSVPLSLANPNLPDYKSTINPVSLLPPTSQYSIIPKSLLSNMNQPILTNNIPYLPDNRVLNYPVTSSINPLVDLKPNNILGPLLANTIPRLVKQPYLNNNILRVNPLNQIPLLPAYAPLIPIDLTTSLPSNCRIPYLPLQHSNPPNLEQASFIENMSKHPTLQRSKLNSDILLDDTLRDPSLSPEYLSLDSSLIGNELKISNESETAIDWDNLSPYDNENTYVLEKEEPLKSSSLVEKDPKETGFASNFPLYEDFDNLDDFTIECNPIDKSDEDIDREGLDIHLEEDYQNTDIEHLLHDEDILTADLTEPSLHNKPMYLDSSLAGPGLSRKSLHNHEIINEEEMPLEFESSSLASSIELNDTTLTIDSDNSSITLEELDHVSKLESPLILTEQDKLDLENQPSSNTDIELSAEPLLEEETQSNNTELPSVSDVLYEESLDPCLIETDTEPEGLQPSDTLLQPLENEGSDISLGNIDLESDFKTESPNILVNSLFEPILSKSSSDSPTGSSLTGPQLELTQDFIQTISAKDIESPNSILSSVLSPEYRSLNLNPDSQSSQLNEAFHEVENIDATTIISDTTKLVSETIPMEIEPKYIYSEIPSSELDSRASNIESNIVEPCLSCTSETVTNLSDDSKSLLREVPRPCHPDILECQIEKPITMQTSINPQFAGTMEYLPSHVMDKDLQLPPCSPLIPISLPNIPITPILPTRNPYLSNYHPVSPHQTLPSSPELYSLLKSSPILTDLNLSPFRYIPNGLPLGRINPNIQVPNLLPMNSIMTNGLPLDINPCASPSHHATLSSELVPITPLTEYINQPLESTLPLGQCIERIFSSNLIPQVLLKTATEVDKAPSVPTLRGFSCLEPNNYEITETLEPCSSQNVHESDFHTNNKPLLKGSPISDYNVQYLDPDTLSLNNEELSKYTEIPNYNRFPCNQIKKSFNPSLPKIIKKFKSETSYPFPNDCFNSFSNILPSADFKVLDETNEEIHEVKSVQDIPRLSLWTTPTNIWELDKKFPRFVKIPPSSTDFECSPTVVDDITSLLDENKSLLLKDKSILPCSCSIVNRPYSNYIEEQDISESSSLHSHLQDESLIEPNIINSMSCKEKIVDPTQLFPINPYVSLVTLPRPLITPILKPKPPTVVPNRPQDYNPMTISPVTPLIPIEDWKTILPNPQTSLYSLPYDSEISPAVCLANLPLSKYSLNEQLNKILSLSSDTNSLPFEILPSELLEPNVLTSKDIAIQISGTDSTKSQYQKIPCLLQRSINPQINFQPCSNVELEPRLTEEIGPAPVVCTTFTNPLLSTQNITPVLKYQNPLTVTSIKPLPLAVLSETTYPNLYSPAEILPYSEIPVLSDPKPIHTTPILPGHICPDIPLKTSTFPIDATSNQPTFIKKILQPLICPQTGYRSILTPDPNLLKELSKLSPSHMNLLPINQKYFSPISVEPLKEKYLPTYIDTILHSNISPHLPLIPNPSMNIPNEYIEIKHPSKQLLSTINTIKNVNQKQTSYQNISPVDTYPIHLEKLLPYHMQPCEYIKEKNLKEPKPVSSLTPKIPPYGSQEDCICMECNETNEDDLENIDAETCMEPLSNISTAEEYIEPVIDENLLHDYIPLVPESIPTPISSKYYQKPCLMPNHPLKLMPILPPPPSLSPINLTPSHTSQYPCSVTSSRLIKPLTPITATISSPISQASLATPILLDPGSKLSFTPLTLSPLTGSFETVPTNNNFFSAPLYNSVFFPDSTTTPISVPYIKYNLLKTLPFESRKLGNTISSQINPHSPMTTIYSPLQPCPKSKSNTFSSTINTSPSYPITEPYIPENYIQLSPISTKLTPITTPFPESLVKFKPCSKSNHYTTSYINPVEYIPCPQTLRKIPAPIPSKFIPISVMAIPSSSQYITSSLSAPLKDNDSLTILPTSYQEYTSLPTEYTKPLNTKVLNGTPFTFPASFSNVFEPMPLSSSVLRPIPPQQSRPQEYLEPSLYSRLKALPVGPPSIVIQPTAKFVKPLTRVAFTPADSVITEPIHAIPLNQKYFTPKPGLLITENYEILPPYKINPMSNIPYTTQRPSKLSPLPVPRFSEYTSLPIELLPYRLIDKPSLHQVYNKPMYLSPTVLNPLKTRELNTLPLEFIPLESIPEPNTLRPLEVFNHSSTPYYSPITSPYIPLSSSMELGQLPLIGVPFSPQSSNPFLNNLAQNPLITKLRTNFPLTPLQSLNLNKIVPAQLVENVGQMPEIYPDVKFSQMPEFQQPQSVMTTPCKLLKSPLEKYELLPNNIILEQKMLPIQPYSSSTVSPMSVTPSSLMKPLLSEANYMEVYSSPIVQSPTVLNQLNPFASKIPSFINPLIPIPRRSDSLEPIFISPTLNTEITSSNIVEYSNKEANPTEPIEVYPVTDSELSKSLELQDISDPNINEKLLMPLKYNQIKSQPLYTSFYMPESKLAPATFTSSKIPQSITNVPMSFTPLIEESELLSDISHFETLPTNVTPILTKAMASKPLLGRPISIPPNLNLLSPKNLLQTPIFGKYIPYNENLDEVTPKIEKELTLQEYNPIEEINPVIPRTQEKSNKLQKNYQNFEENMNLIEVNEYEDETKPIFESENLILSEIKPDIANHKYITPRFTDITKICNIKKPEIPEDCYSNNKIGKCPLVYTIPRYKKDSMLAEILRDYSSIPAKYLESMPSLKTPVELTNCYKEMKPQELKTYDQNVLKPLYNIQEIENPMESYASPLYSLNNDLEDLKYSGYKTYQIPKLKYQQKNQHLGSLPEIYNLTPQPFKPSYLPQIPNPTHILKAPEISAPLKTKLGLNPLEHNSDFSEYIATEDVIPIADNSKENKELKSSLANYLDKNETIKDKIYNNNDEITIPLGDIGIIKKEIVKPDIITTGDPSIGLKIWKSKLKNVKAELKLKFNDISVNNFMPIINTLNNYDIEEIRKIVKSYIDDKYGSHIEIDKPYTIDNQYAVIKDLDKGTENKYNLLWPTDYV